jgi:hypothetical protein
MMDFDLLDVGRLESNSASRRASLSIASLLTNDGVRIRGCPSRPKVRMNVDSKLAIAWFGGLGSGRRCAANNYLIFYNKMGSIPSVHDSPGFSKVIFSTARNTVFPIVFHKISYWGFGREAGKREHWSGIMT